MLVLAAGAAQAEPWLCSEPDGTQQWSYEPESAKKKNCVNHPIDSRGYVRARPRDANKAIAFPKVERGVQKERDLARRELLERELAEERKSLASAMRQLEEQRELRVKAGQAARLEEKLKPFQERIRVHLSNIANIERELGKNHSG